MLVSFRRHKRCWRNKDRSQLRLMSPPIFINYFFVSLFLSFHLLILSFITNFLVCFTHFLLYLSLCLLVTLIFHFFVHRSFHLLNYFLGYLYSSLRRCWFIISLFVICLYLTYRYRQLDSYIYSFLSFLFFFLFCFCFFLFSFSLRSRFVASVWDCARQSGAIEGDSDKVDRMFETKKKEEKKWRKNFFDRKKKFYCYVSFVILPVQHGGLWKRCWNIWLNCKNFI